VAIFRTDEGIRKFSQPLPGALNPARGATHIHVHVGAAGAEESNIDIASIVLVGFVHASRAGGVRHRWLRRHFRPPLYIFYRESLRNTQGGAQMTSPPMAR
jgi:hypothetical protein